MFQICMSSLTPSPSPFGEGGRGETAGEGGEAVP